jgi:hypothetical protein
LEGDNKRRVRRTNASSSSRVMEVTGQILRASSHIPAHRITTRVNG